MSTFYKCPKLLYDAKSQIIFFKRLGLLKFGPWHHVRNCNSGQNIGKHIFPLQFVVRHKHSCLLNIVLGFPYYVTHNLKPSFKGVHVRNYSAVSFS